MTKDNGNGSRATIREVYMLVESLRKEMRQDRVEVKAGVDILHQKVDTIDSRLANIEGKASIVSLVVSAIVSIVSNFFFFRGGVDR